MKPRREQGVSAALILIALGIALSACGSASQSSAGDAILRFGGDDGAAALLEGVVNAYEQTHPEMVVSVTPGSRARIAAQVVADEIDAAFLTSAPPLDDFFHTPVGRDGIALIVSPQNPVESVSREQARSLLAGRIATWELVGGQGLTVLPIAYNTTSSIRAALETALGIEDAISSAARLVSSPSEMLTLVASSPAAIGFVPLSALTGEVKPLPIDHVPPTLEDVSDGSYPLSITIEFVSPTEPRGAARDFLNWLVSRDGQTVVRRIMLGFND